MFVPGKLFQPSPTLRVRPGVDLIKLSLGVNLLTLFVSYTILELWKHNVDNNEMVYLTKNPE